MSDQNLEVILIAIGACLILVVLLIVKNRKDRKDIFPPQATDDPVEQTRMVDKKRQDKI